MHAHANINFAAEVPPSPTTPSGILKKPTAQTVYKSSKFDVIRQSSTLHNVPVGGESLFGCWAPI